MREQTLVWCLALILFGNVLLVNIASGNKIDRASLDGGEHIGRDELGEDLLNLFRDERLDEEYAGASSGQTDENSSSASKEIVKPVTENTKPTNSENEGVKDEKDKENAYLRTALGKESGDKKPESGEGSEEQKPGSGGKPGKGSGEQGKPGKGSGEQGKPGKDSEEQGKPGKGSGEHGKPGKGSGEQGKPGKDSEEQGKPGKGSGEHGKPGKGSGEQGKPGKDSGEQGKPGKGSGEQGKPGKGSGEQGKPGKGSGEHGKPGKGSGEQGKPGKDSGEQGKPGKGSGEQGKPGKDSGEHGKPGKGSGEHSKPGKGSGEQGKPGKDSEEQGKPGKGSGEHGKPGKGSGEQGKPGKDSGEHGKPGKGSGEQGKPGKDSGEHGKPGKDSGEQGKPGKDSGEQGKPGKGSGEQGKPGKGSGEQGKPGKGSGEQSKPGKDSDEDPAKGSGEGSSESGSSGSSEWHYNPEKQTIFTLHTTKTSSKGKVIKLNNRQSLKESGFNPSKQTRILIHHSKHKGSAFRSEVTKAYLKKGKYNVIVVNWEKGARGKQRETLQNAIHVSKVIAGFVDFLVSSSPTSINRIYLIGHGLGAHIAGLAGRSVSVGVIPVIFALDPTNIHRPWLTVSKYDAKYVEIIYTSSAPTGRARVGGHAIFYVNYGTKQPGCNDKDATCSQNRAYEYFAESINSQDGFYGKSCGNPRQLVSNQKCTNPGEKIEEMGGSSARNKEYGIFYVPTKSSSPYAEGEEAVLKD